MNAEQVIALADQLRTRAPTQGRDLNASNLYVHEMLMRTFEQERDERACEEQQRAS